MTGEIPPGPEQPQEQDGEPPSTSHEAQEQPRVEIKDSRGVVVGNFARVVINGIDEKVFRRFGVSVNLGFGLLALLILFAAGMIVYFLLPKQGNMRKEAGCELCIAIAPFVEVPSSAEDEIEGIGEEFGATLSARLQNNLAEIKDRSEMTIDVWGPQKVGRLKGRTIEELDRSAPGVAQAAGADILVYGLIHGSGNHWDVTPRFFISPDFLFQDAPEIVGQDQLGSPFEAVEKPISARKRKMNDQASSNGRLLAALAVGMTYYSTHDYDSALKIFETASADVGSWKDPAAVRLLYLMMGNSLLRQSERNPGQMDLLDQAGQNFNAARGSDDSYARAFLGLGSVAYLKALTLALASGDPLATDLQLLEESETSYQKALSLAPTPDLAHVREKAYTYLGRVLLARGYRKFAATGQLPGFDDAADKFTLVVQAYERTQNEEDKDGVLKDLAAEAHAGLALIAQLEGRTTDSITEYQAAIDLTDDQARKDKYQQALMAQQSLDP
jgi:tetratricopeptide (TPR) repeat protein